MTVIRAYKTDHFPFGGNISEEILVLEDGRAVFLTPNECDELCDSESDALALASGEAHESASLKAAWSEGYDC